MDVIFYNPDISYAQTLVLQEELCQAYPAYQWELKNQVYMHGHSPGTAPYLSSRNVMSQFPETCTAIGARLLGDQIEFYLPYGWEAVFDLEVHPTPHFQSDPERLALYQKRQEQ